MNNFFGYSEKSHTSSDFEFIANIVICNNYNFAHKFVSLGVEIMNTE